MALTKTSPPSRESPLGLGEPTRQNAQAGLKKETSPPSRESLWTAGEEQTNALKCAGRLKQRDRPTIQKIPLDGWKSRNQHVKTRRPVRTKRPAYHPENPSGQLEIKKPTHQNTQAGPNKETGPPSRESLWMAGDKHTNVLKRVGRSKQRNRPTIQRIPLDSWRSRNQHIEMRGPARTKRPAHRPENPSKWLVKSKKVK